MKKNIKNERFKKKETENGFFQIYGEKKHI